jgi:hypothetical protein
MGVTSRNGNFLYAKPVALREAGGGGVGIGLGRPACRPARGCKPKPPKISLGQIERRHDGIEVDELPAVTKGVVAVHEDMASGHRRNLLD